MPAQRRFTALTSGVALGVQVIAADDESTLAFVYTGPNMIVDVVNDPDPATGDELVWQLYNGGTDTGVRFYSTAMSSASAGRMAQGAIKLNGGNYQLRAIQRAGTPADNSIILRFAETIK